MSDISKQFRHLMWYTFAGTSGGMERIKIMGLLRERPYNTKQLCMKLDMELSDLIHHIDILAENRFIELGGKKGDSMFFVSDMFENEMATFEEILEKLGVNPKKEIYWKDFRVDSGDNWLWGRGD
jgi:predicted transcriptional regulator